jgi:hypothetical protein
MIKVFCIISLLFSISIANAQKNIKDSCTYHFVDNGAIRNIGKLFDFEELLRLNSRKDFYFAFIRIDADGATKVNECSSLSRGKIIKFDGSIADFDYEHIQIDTLILFRYIGDSSRVTFERSNCGLGFHAPIKLLVFKDFSRVFLGFSINNSDIMNAFQQVAEKYFVFKNDEHKKSFFALIEESIFKGFH